ncbi:MAG: zinc-dependent metalloprotease [Actinomycetota bacterium]
MSEIDPFEPVDIPKPPEGWWEQVPVLHELYKLLSSNEPVNWELARQVGVALASYDETPPADLDPAELDAITRAASVEAEAFAEMSAGSVADVRVVTRAQWVEANLDSFRFVMNPLAKKMAPPADQLSMLGQGTQILSQISGVFMGLQTGFVLGYMGRSVIGQYELPLPAPSPTRLLYVASNLEQMERDWSLDPKQFRYWIALHEITHHIEFSHPWVQKYFRSQILTLIDSLDFDPTRMQSAFEGLDMLDPERLAERLQDPEALIQAAWTPLSKDAMARLQAFMTLAEGYATFVMDAVGAKLLSEHARLKEAMERRRQSLSPGDALLERLLGIELKRRQYEDGVRFCRYVAGMRDVASLNRAWENPETLPTLDELADPDTWITRVLD